MTKPRILITNDDGIHAPGIFALWEAMSEIGDVTVVAPNTEKSAVGHAITISDPIRIQEITRHGGFTGYSVDGTPGDCVKVAIHSILDQPPDLVVSGINMGANVGTNILYSGTVSAANLGTMLGFNSIAFSLDAIKDGDFSASKPIAQKVAKLVLKNSLPNGTLLNVNIPNCEASDIQGFQVTKQGSEFFQDWLESREDPRGRTYFWMTGKIINTDDQMDLDGFALGKNYVSLTPIHYQLTNESFLDELNTWNVK
ncbi:MAG: 5'/3'-nucleotidase SurE [Candidatus Marinimicrobia bacterium]|jgi:5'-nucleotidase|uniref:5'-nucleotidase SurE n=1 Tax=uncultured bacterium FPPS_57A9 TaxID=1343847 RepID=S4W9Y3_9BACT|nr:stationary phase survival protein SurE [uncultured bacterium FPPS_57A9]MBT3300377.1 5'/3'-nucleotidase SurE [Candidatus Neomarinimicrobiota bacterium]MBT3495986.1 5'/3'-nucleotidase SurE [Candidatus Neomarinimicrobiota bacterium]MBT3691822.1 5'/3'-nucleotidase SurE [Candidatus Neomarinimicrobiota bacterium]MBT3732708.1 5'/3'-nucleotidase SurE [Candidatus Neomarinimicrobiota bacterium]